MATGDKLVNLDELKLVYDKLHVPSVQVQIPTGQWSGSSTRTYTVNATGVTTDTIIDWAMDSSINYLTSELTVTPGSGTLTFSTPTLPAGTINVTLFFPGVNGEVVIQTLADVYSKSQTDTLLAAKVSTSNIINNLTSTSTTAPLSANMGKTLEEHIQQSTANGYKLLLNWSNYSSGDITLTTPFPSGRYLCVIQFGDNGRFFHFFRTPASFASDEILSFNCGSAGNAIVTLSSASVINVQLPSGIYLKTIGAYTGIKLATT